MVQVKRVQATENANRIIAILQEEGCVVIEGLLSEHEIKALQGDLSKEFEQIPDCKGDFYGYATKRIGSLFSKSEVCQEMAIHPTVLSVMDEFLLKGCSQYQVNLTQAISIGPQENPQIIHQDDSMFPFIHPNHEVMINCMWAVTDFTADNGATVLAPGSHLWPRTQIIDLENMRLPKPDEITQGEMKAGSVLIYLGSLYHAGGQNKTNESRVGAVISYSLGWLRQAENNYLAYSKEEVREMPERLQRLLGYFVHSPNLGSLEGQDPIKILSEEGLGKNFEEFVPEEVKPLLKEYQASFKKAA